MATQPMWADQRTPALAIVAKGDQIHHLPNGLFDVQSQSAPARHYLVAQQGGAWSCECDHHLNVGRQCIHIIATRFWLQTDRDTPEGTRTERVPITRTQAWRAYNAAQTSEVRLFDSLLADLCSTLPAEGGPRRRGNQPMPLREQVFCAVQKVYSQLSSRRAASLFGNAQERGQIEHAPHFNATSKFLNRPEAKPILHDLIRQSAVPLAGIEMDFAVDSTGFSTKGGGSYRVEKYGVETEYTWLKAHFCVGTRTHIVADVAITEGNGGDSPQFAPLVRQVAQGFFVNEVSADKAYSSRANHDVVRAVGGEALIPFKSNAAAHPSSAKASLAWRKAFHYFQAHQEEFYARYHKRSNVESVNSAIKRKLGEGLKSKNRVAMENELLCKILAYNLTVLIHEMFESGLALDFCTPNAKDAPEMGSY